jgi:RNA polymerase sigma-70 factor (ECF subfamily)
MLAAATAYSFLHTQIIDWKALSDEDVIAAYGNPSSRNQAADELFRRHQPRISRWCYRFLRDREQALDVSQDVLLRAYRHLDHYRGDCRFSTWLYVITRNVCMTVLQKRVNEPSWIYRTEMPEIPDLAASAVHSDLEHRQLRNRQWSHILETLDQTEARVMMLHYGEELPLQSVTRMLGLTNKSGAKAFIVSARRKLAKASVQ